MLLVLFGASLILFACLYIVPGDPIQTQQGEGRQLDQATRELLEKRYGLDQPLPNQYVHYVGRLAQGDMGESYTFRRPVNDILGEKLGNTLKLGLAAFGVQIVLGLIAGIVAAISRYSFLDVVVTLSTTVAIGIPTFVIGLAVQQVFAINLSWLPLQGSRGAGRASSCPR